VRTHRRAAAALAGLALLTVAAAACGGSHTASYPAVTPPPVPLSVGTGLAHALTIGLVVSGSSAPGQGSDDLGLAAGARVAAYRLDLEKAGAVRLEVVDDHGTSAGSAAAVRQLLADQVAGIVYASEGSHLNVGVALAQAAHTAVLLPYATSAPTGDDVWLTGPAQDQDVAELSVMLSTRSLTTPLVLSTSPVGGLGQMAPDARSAALTDSSTLTAQVAADITTVGKSGGPDSVVVWGPAQAEADAVAALQQAGTTVPVLLGPSALSPVFAQTLTTLGAQGAATTSGQYLTAGLAATDNSTAASVSTFLQAVRLAASDSAVDALVSTATFSTDGAGTADSRAHDAVLALADAAATARSVAPAAVENALAGLTVPTSVGLAGPALNFTGQEAVPATAVVGLQATAQSSGQRAGIAQTVPALSWFALGSPG
jgi:branched-chain amino acid transport system substrate-binding protein